MFEDALNAVIRDEMSRRALMLKALKGSAAGVAVLAVPSALAACGSGDSSTGAGTTASGGTPVRGGTLKASFSGDIGHVGTADWGLTGYSTGYAIFSRLTRLSEDGLDVQPDLLEALPEIADGGKTYTFKLREGVRFHDGSQLTAEDVKFSLERAIDPRSGQQAGGIYGAFGILGTADFTAGKAKELKGLRVVDPLTVVMTLEQPNSAVLGALAMTMASIVPKAYVQSVGEDVFETKAPIGSGPYRVASYAPSKTLVLEQFADYFDPDTAGYVERVELELNVDPSVAVLRIERGEQDLMHDRVPTGALNQIRNDPQYSKNLLIGPENRTYFATLSTKHPAMSDARVRQAIAYATDREKVVRQLGGVGRPADGGLFSPLSGYYQPGIGYAYDPEKARALLAEAGFPKGFEVELIAQSFDPQRTLGESLADDLAAIGITVKTRLLQSSAFGEAVLRFPPAITINNWELPYPHGSYIIDSAFTQGAVDAGCCNFSSWVDPRFDGLAKEAHLAQSPEEQAKLYKQMDTIIVHDQSLWVPMVYSEFPALHSSRLQGYEVPRTPTGDTLYFAKYWIDA